MNQSDIYHYEMEQNREYQEYKEYAYQMKQVALEEEFYHFEHNKNNE